MALYLVPCTAAFDYDRHDLPPSVHYVGPYLWNRPHHEEPPAWLRDLGRGRPCVHVTEGTTHIHKPIVLDAALKGLADLPLDVVMTTGGERAPEHIGSGPTASNIRLERWVSHSDLLPLTDVMVTTGGGNSVLSALSAGVPLVVVPTEWDKPEIAQRVVESGAGVRLQPRDCTPERLREAVLTVLRDGRFRANAERLSRSFADAGGAELAAELILNLGRHAGPLTTAPAAAARPQ